MTAAEDSPCLDQPVSLSFVPGSQGVGEPWRPSQLGGRRPDGQTIGLTSTYLELNGRPTIPVMGECHYSRMPNRFWDRELRKVVAGGIDMLGTYVFWIHHEEEEGRFDWTGDRDLRRFIQSCARHGLQVVVRIGPFAHGECRNGGLPDWLYGRPFAVRSTDSRFLDHVRRLYQAIATQLDGLLFKDGGPVIGVQLDNEYMHAGAPWETTYRKGTEWVPGGDEGDTYMLALKQLAIEAGLVVPLYTCTAWIGSPVPEDQFLPMQGGYAFTPWIPEPEYQQPPSREFLFRDRRRDPVTGGVPTYDPSRYPYASCELGGGIQITYHHRPIVPPQCVEGMAVVALGSGANMLGYYMYHGGSQPIGRHAYLNEHSVPRISYDFQAPIGESGRLAPSFHALRLLHYFLRAYGEQLATMAVALPDGAEALLPEDAATPRFAARYRDDQGFLFLTNYQDHLEMPDRCGLRWHIQAGETELMLPRHGGLGIAAGASAILPINLNVGSHRLVYSTCQPLTVIEGAEGTVQVFFAVPGMACEYAFDHATIASVRGATVESTAESDRLYLRVRPGSSSLITMNGTDGSRHHLLTLTREQALHCWQVRLGGADRLLLFDGLVLAAGERLMLTYSGAADRQLGVFPPLVGGLNGSDVRLAERDDGVFSAFAITSRATEVVIDLEDLGGDRYLIPLSRPLPPAVDDAYLRIAYEGDIGEAYLDGRLVSDNFYNGTVWEIALGPLRDRLVSAELVIKIVPLRCDTGALRYVPTGMAARMVESGERIARITAVTLLTEHTLTLHAG